MNSANKLLNKLKNLEKQLPKIVTIKKNTLEELREEQDRLINEMKTVRHRLKKVRRRIREEMHIPRSPNRKIRKKKTEAHKEYCARLNVLGKLGFQFYDDYLHSDLWGEIRTRVLQRDGNACKYCGKKATEVHHLRYSKNDMNGKKISNLVSICRTCHDGISKINREENLNNMNATKAYIDRSPFL